MRVETVHGEATVIICRGVVEHASPAMAWAFGWPVETLKLRLADLEWIAVMVMPESITYPTPTRRI